MADESMLLRKVEEALRAVRADSAAQHRALHDEMTRQFTESHRLHDETNKRLDKVNGRLDRHDAEIDAHDIRLAEIGRDMKNITNEVFERPARELVSSELIDQITRIVGKADAVDEDRKPVLTRREFKVVVATIAGAQMLMGLIWWVITNVKVAP